MIQQMTKMMVMLVLAIGLTTVAATAQDKNGGFAPVGIYKGIETSEGTFDQLSQLHYGDTFVMNSFGEWESYHLTVSLDYSISQFIPNNFIVMGGKWSLVVVRDNQYAGTMYGEVQTGSLSFTNNGENSSKNVQLNLRSTGGLGMFAGQERKNISGVYNATTDLRSKETQGKANFDF